MILTQGLISHLENGDVKMGIDVKMDFPVKYYMEEIAKAKKAGDMKKVEKLKESLKLKREQDLKDLENTKLDKSDEETLKRLSKKTSNNKGIVREMKKSKGGAVKKPEMMYGGMANNKKHMYAAGGSVTDNPGLKALARKRPDVVKKMGYNV